MGFAGERDLQTESPNISTDYFIVHPLLQPKLEVANYVESKGIAVPYRFKNLFDALSSGKKFIIRSEHPQDYAGASGLLASHVFTPETIEKLKTEFASKPVSIDWERYFKSVGREWDIEDHVLSQIDTVDQNTFEGNLKLISSKDPNRQYWDYATISKEEFFSKVSYSYWEYLDGENRTIIADNTLKDRYHIFTRVKSSKTSRWVSGYTIIDLNGMRDYSPVEKNENPINSDFQSIINFYKQVRGLDRFAGNHCPIVEVQTVGNKCYFLQYHRGTDMASTPSFTLDRMAQEGEAEAIWVRGATSENGIILNTNIYRQAVPRDLREENAAFEKHYDVAFSELMIRQRRVQFIQGEDIAAYITQHHLSVSQLFKPHISIILTDKDAENVFSEEKDLCESDDFIHHKRVRVISDGRRALVSSAENL